jgi:hypothetical protein
MLPCLAFGQYPVAVHRWFARGEDWAVHPALAEHLPEIVRLLDARLKAREVGPFRLPLDDGEILGEMQDDPHCLDSRARARRPVIIRLTQVPGRVQPQEHESFLKALRGVPLPVSPGIDQGLIVSTEIPVDRPVALLSRRKPPEPAKSQRGWLLVLAGGAVALGLVVPLAILWNNARPSPRSPALPATENKLPEASRSPETLRALLRRYEAVDHPYVHFLLKHPEALARSPQRDDPRYETWRAGQRRSFAAATHPLPRKLREQVAQWREPAPELQALCLRLRELRRDLDPSGPARPTAIEEIEALFETLTRPSGLPPREEFDHSANAFLARLPRDPFRAGQTFDSVEEARDTLRAFVNDALQTQPPLDTAVSTAALVNRLRDELNYLRWREQQQRRGTVFADENASLDERLRQAIRRFGGP